MVNGSVPTQPRLVNKCNKSWELEPTKQGIEMACSCLGAKGGIEKPTKIIVI